MVDGLRNTDSAYYAALLSGVCCAALLLDMSVRYVIPRFRRRRAPVNTKRQDQPEKLNVAEVAPSYAATGKTVSQAVSSQVMPTLKSTRAKPNEHVQRSTEAQPTQQTQYSLLSLHRDLVQVNEKEVNKTSLQEEVLPGCSDMLSVLSNLENQFTELSHNIDVKAFTATAISKNEDDEIFNDPGPMIREASACMAAASTQWSNLRTLLYCLDVHMKNAASFHMFLLESARYEKCMTAALDSLVTTFDEAGKTLESDSIEKYIQQVQRGKDTLTFWEGIVHDMTTRSGSIIPLPRRITQSEEAIRVKMLCNYKTDTIELMEGEHLNLIDSSEYPKWKVQTLRDQEATVPAICCLVTPPDGTIIDTVNRLRIKLCVMIALNVKALGKYLIWLNTAVYQDWNNKQSTVGSLSKQQKDGIQKFLTDMISWIEPYWERYARYDDLKTSSKDMEQILNQTIAAKDDVDGGETNLFHVDMLDLEKGYLLYRELWNKWELFRALVDASSHPQFVLMAERWEQMKMVSPETLLKYWHTELTEEDLVTTGDEETSENVGVNIQRESSTAVASEYVEEEVEVKETFSITGVIDPQTMEQVSIQDATRRGIIDPREGRYVNKQTGESMLISTAMAQGLIVVESVKSKKMKEEKLAVGVLKVTIQRETRPYTIVRVKDPKTDEEISIDDAVKMGIIDKENGMYINLETGKRIAVADAIDMGDVFVEFDSEAEETPPQVITKTYAIHDVLDKKRNSRVSFTEAVSLKIIDANTGTYRNAISGEEMGIADAMKKGFVKADIVTDE